MIKNKTRPLKVPCWYDTINMSLWPQHWLPEEKAYKIPKHSALKLLLKSMYLFNICCRTKSGVKCTLSY